VALEGKSPTQSNTAKVTRGWKTAKTPIAEGQRIQYNFVKPHMALEGKTPAEASGLQAKGWKELMKLAMS